MDFLPFLHFFNLLVYLYLAVFILLKRPGSPLNRVFCAFIFCFALWNLGDIFIHSTFTPQEALPLFTNINSIGWASFSSFFLWFTVLFTEKKNITRSLYFYFFLFIFPLFFIFAQWSGFLIDEWEQRPWGWASMWPQSSLSYIFYCYYLSFMLLSLYLLADFIRKSKALHKKKQAKIILISIAIPLVFGTLTDVVLPRFDFHEFPDLANTFTLIWVIGIIIAMMRYKFFTPTPAMAADNIISTMTDALILLDTQGTIVQVNNAALNLLGYPKGELEGNNVDFIFSEEEFKRDTLDKIINGEEVIENYDLYVKTKDEVHVPVSFSTSTLQEEGVFAGLVCIAQDITTRVKAREALKRARDELDISVKLRTKELSNTNKELMNEIMERRKSEKALQAEKFYLSSLFESAPQAVAMSDENHIVQRVNSEFTRLFGYTQDEAVGRHIDELIAPQEYLKEAESLTEDIARGNRINKESIRKRKDGKRINVSILASPIIINDKRVGTFGIYQDITERKRAEEEKKELEEQFHQAQKMEAIGQLAGGISHDFNNMLSVITGFAEIIKRKYTADNPTLREYIEKIFDAAMRSADLNAKLLAFARKGKFKIAEVDVNAIILNIIGMLEHTSDKRINILEEFKADKAIVMGDDAQLQNAFLNIAINALDAMPNGGELKFKTDIVDLDEKYIKSHSSDIIPGTYLEIIITDTGIGMDEKIIARIFEPFFTTKGLGKGTGLGLASVFGTIENHKGFIGVKSEVGVGTTFKIHLPLADTFSEKTGEVPEELHKGSGNILIVDDEELIREMFIQMLDELGYTTATCNNGEEALEYYREHHKNIDLVIIDLMMPRLGGYDCLKGLKKINKNIKVIISSGYSVDGGVSKIIEEGALVFIKKPFDINELSEAVYQAMQKEK